MLLYQIVKNRIQCAKNLPSCLEVVALTQMVYT